MDPRDYHDARWHALLRAAEALGVPEADASGVIRRVLAAQERRIRRSDDPHPLVLAALEREVGAGPADASTPRRGARQRPRRGVWPAYLAVAEAALLAVTLGVVSREAPLPPDRLARDQMPSLFGYDGAHARAALAARGLRVRLVPFRSCEVQGRVVASDPATGERVRPGERVVVYTAVPSSITCLTDYQDRALVWDFLDFAAGRGPAPAFADRVFVYPGDARRFVLGRPAAGRGAGWRETGVLEALRRAGTQVARTDERPPTYAVPALRMLRAGQDTDGCGGPTPSVAGRADTVAVLVRPADRRGCGLRLELYRDAQRRIEAVALYRPPS